MWLENNWKDNERRVKIGKPQETVASLGISLNSVSKFSGSCVLTLDQKRLEYEKEIDEGKERDNRRRRRNWK